MGSTLHSAAGLSPDCMTIESQIAGDTDHLLSSIAEPSVRRIINNFYKNASSFYSRVALLTDSHSICPSLDLAKKAAHAFSSSVYYYVASFEEPVTCSNGTTPLHLAHSLSDISAILGHYLCHLFRSFYLLFVLSSISFNCRSFDMQIVGAHSDQFQAAF